MLSMLLDVHWFYDWLINTISDGGKQAKSIGAIAKAGRSAKIAARAIRILRVLRIIRLVRVSKLYKAKEKLVKLDLKKKEKERLKKENEEKQRLQMIKENNNMVNQEDKGEETKKIVVNVTSPNNEMIKINKPEQDKVIINQQVLNNNNTNMSQISKLTENSTSSYLDDSIEDKPVESKVGKLLAEKTTKRVIILVLSMMISIILFNSSFYIEEKTGMEYGLKIFNGFKSINDPNFNLSFSIYVNEFIGADSPIIYARVGYLQYGTFNDTLSLRNSEQNSYGENCSNLIPNDSKNSICEAVFDIRNSTRLSAL